MSSTNRGGQRNADDFYATPAWCTRAILPHAIGAGEFVSVLDPACGEGAILDVVRAARPTVRTIGFELDAGRSDACGERGHTVLFGDALARSARDWHANVIVMNPPFALAMPFVERAIGCVETVACLLRLAFLASQKRAAFWRAHPADVYVLPKRPSFTGQGTDSADYAWFVWGTGRGGRWQILDVEGAR